MKYNIVLQKPVWAWIKAHKDIGSLSKMLCVSVSHNTSPLSSFLPRSEVIVLTWADVLHDREQLHPNQTSLGHFSRQGTPAAEHTLPVFVPLRHFIPTPESTALQMKSRQCVWHCKTVRGIYRLWFGKSSTNSDVDSCTRVDLCSVLSVIQSVTL